MMLRDTQRKILGWSVIAFITIFNCRLFLSRWAEEPRAPFKPLISGSYIDSFAIGLAAVALAFSAFEALRSRRFLSLVLLGAVSALLLFIMPGIGMGEYLKGALSVIAGLGAAIGFVLFRVGEGKLERCEAKFLASFTLMALASFNVFLLMAPWTNHVPSYMQDRFAERSPLAYFYYGSVHSDLSPVSMAMRWVINSFFDYPSINATALSSMVYVSLGLALAGLALEMVFGPIWGWGLLFLAWTDRWLFASAVSSAIIGQPVLSNAHVLLLCTWALWRRAGPLSWGEAGVLSAVNLFGFLFNLYGYSAARMTWLVGSGIAALILIFRKAVWFNLDGYRKVALAVLPSIVLVVSIWFFIFDRDTPRFVNQLVISPPLAHRVRDINSYRTPLTPIHDVDNPIWWGTGRPVDGENKTIYWKRTPKEIFDKARWFMQQVAVRNPLPIVLVFLGGVGMALGVASATPIRRWFSLCLLILTFTSFSTYVLAQDTSAYRRALATDLYLAVGAVSFFASKIRGRLMSFIAVGLCGVLAFLKAPGEYKPLFDESFFSEACVNCGPLIDVRILVKDPGFIKVSGRSIKYVVEGQGISPLYGRCAQLAFESNELKRLTPRSSVVNLAGRKFSQLFAELTGDDVLLVSCSNGVGADPELAGICRGEPPFGVIEALIPAERKPQGERIWWAVVGRG